ncbi:MAG: hypothetical protein AAGA77_19155 [Bacteroidota bacterium]
MKNILNCFFPDVFNETVLALSEDISSQETILNANSKSSFKIIAPTRLKSMLNTFQRKAIAIFMTGMIVLELYWFSS